MIGIAYKYRVCKAWAFSSVSIKYHHQTWPNSVHPSKDITVFSLASDNINYFTRCFCIVRNDRIRITVCLLGRGWIIFKAKAYFNPVQELFFQSVRYLG